jgi:hypothetical protein
VPEQRSQSSRESLLLREMGTSLRRYWMERTGYQTFLVYAAGLLFLSAAVHVVVFLIAGGGWEGPLSWRKPILFGFSFGITVLTIAWVLGFLPRRRLLGWVLALTLGVASIAEVLLISMQTWRGVPSHFNEATPLDSMVFSAMGALVALVALAILAVTIWSFVSLRAAPSMAWAIRGGLLLLLVSQALGGAIIANGLTQAGDQVTATASTFGAGGAMKVPHAVSLHALQTLPALAWLLGFSDWPERRRLQIVLVAAAGYVGLQAVTVLQTFGGRATLQLDAAAAALLTISLLALIAPFAVTIWHLTRSRAAPSRVAPA